MVRLAPDRLIEDRLRHGIFGQDAFRPPCRGGLGRPARPRGMSSPAMPELPPFPPCPRIGEEPFMVLPGYGRLKRQPPRQSQRLESSPFRAIPGDRAPPAFRDNQAYDKLLPRNLWPRSRPGGDCRLFGDCARLADGRLACHEKGRDLRRSLQLLRAQSLRGRPELAMGSAIPRGA